MKRNIVNSVMSTLIISGLFLFSGISFAVDEGMQTAIGEKEFLKSCAACHGQSAKGDGPVAAVLKTTPSNLRLISQRNDGKFPTTKIYHLIDGGAMLGPHGSKEMPVWGDRYRADAISQISGIPHDLSPEAIVHGRILSLVYYLETIQK